MAITLRITKLALALSLGVSSTIAFASQAQDDLLSVVQETLNSNPELQFQLDAFNASVDERRQAFGGYLPSLDLNLSAAQAERDFDNRGSYNRNYAEISLTQMLFDGFKVRNELAKAEHTSLARYYDLLDEAQTKALEASDAYLAVLRHRELVTLAQQNLAHHQRVQEQVADRAKRGVSNRADLQQVDSRVSLARSNLVTEITNLQTVTARFQRLVGRFPADQLSGFEIPEQAIPSSISSVLETVYTNNPALFAAAQNTQAAEASYGEAKSRRYPTIELGARHGTYKNNNSFDARTDPRTYGDESMIELRARYNLYNGGSDKAAEGAAYNRISQAQSMHNKACVDLRQTATIAYQDVANLQTKLESLAAHQQDAANVVVAYRQQFNIGRRSLLDVLDSENESFQSQRAYIDGLYDLQQSRLQTLHSMGLLLDTLSVSSDKIPTLSEVSGAKVNNPAQYCAIEANAYDTPRYMKAVAKENFSLNGDTLFDSGSATLKPEAIAQLQQLVQKILAQGNPKAIHIVGHTDSVGTEASNHQLSVARATAVRDALVNSGVEHTTLVVSGVGASQPVASNDTAQGRALNHRVEFTVNRA